MIASKQQPLSLFAPRERCTAFIIGQLTSHAPRSPQIRPINGLSMVNQRATLVIKRPCVSISVFQLFSQTVARSWASSAVSFLPSARRSFASATFCSWRIRSRDTAKFLATSSRVFGFSPPRPKRSAIIFFSRLTRLRSPQHNAFESGTSPFRNAVLFFKARFETFQIYWNPRLRTFRSRPKILYGPCDGLV